MPITVAWNDKSKTFIKCQFNDPWSTEQFIEARKAWHRMIKSTEHSVPILLDLRETHEAPTGTLRHFSAIHRTPHPRQGHLYVLGLNRPYQLLAPFVFCCQAESACSVRLIDSLDGMDLA